MRLLRQPEATATIPIRPRGVFVHEGWNVVEEELVQRPLRHQAMALKDAASARGWARHRSVMQPPTTENSKPASRQNQARQATVVWKPAVKESKEDVE